MFGINTLSCREGRMEGGREGRECERRREGRGRHLLLLRNYNKERKTECCGKVTGKHQLGPNSCIQTVQMSTPILSKTLPVSHATSQQRTPAASVKTDSYKLSCTNNSLSANCLFSPPLNTFGTSEGHVLVVQWQRL